MSNKKVILHDCLDISNDDFELCKNFINQIKNENQYILDCKGEVITAGKIPAIFEIDGNTFHASKFTGVYKYLDDTIYVLPRFDKNFNFLNYLIEVKNEFKKRFASFEISDESVYENEVLHYLENDVEGLMANEFDKTLTLCLFINLLDRAMSRGMFRQYNENLHNDTKIKGRIDISKHITQNQATEGKITYITRDYNEINPINKLILKTFIYFERKNGKLVSLLLRNKNDTLRQINKLKGEFVDIDMVSKSELIKVCSSKIANPIYRDYEVLRKLCIAILKTKGESAFLNNEKRAVGVLMDMSLLWNNYIYNEVLKVINDEGIKGGNFNLMRNKNALTTDYSLIINNKLVAFDIKYSILWENTCLDEKNIDVSMDKINADLSQILDVVNNSESDYGGVIFPVGVDIDVDEAIENFYGINSNYFGELDIKNTSTKFYRIPYIIPTMDMTYKEFIIAMKKINDRVIDKILKEIV